MKTAIVKQFNDQPVEFLTDEKELFITAESLGTALGYKDPRVQVTRLFNRHRDLLEDFTAVVKLTTPGGVQEIRIFNETACNIIAMKANTPKAKEFIKWAAKIITDYRHGKLQKTLPSASLIKEMSKLLHPISLRIFLRDTMNVPLTPKEVLLYYLTLARVNIDTLVKSWGYKNQAYFFIDVNAGTVKHKEELAAMVGLNVSDIWPVR
jgi:hypothetical protein